MHVYNETYQYFYCSRNTSFFRSRNWAGRSRWLRTKLINNAPTFRVLRVVHVVSSCSLLQEHQSNQNDIIWNHVLRFLQTHFFEGRYVFRQCKSIFVFNCLGSELVRFKLLPSLDRIFSRSVHPSECMLQIQQLSKVDAEREEDTTNKSVPMKMS